MADPLVVPDPVCRRQACDAPNHCPHHTEPVHHCVDSLVTDCEAKHQG